MLEPGGGGEAFRWAATAGAWSPYRDGTVPRDASLCGEVIARSTVLLVKNPERAFPVLQQADPRISEALLAPFYLGGVPVGTLWTVKHNLDEQFEAEDARILRSLARFASAAHQAGKALEMAKAASQQSELRAQQLVALAEISTEFFGTCDMEFVSIYGNAAAMQMVGLADLEQVKRTPVLEFFFPEDRAFISEEFFPRVLRDGHGKIETRFRHFVTGEPVWVVYSLVVLKDEMGRPTGLGTVTYDISERKKTEERLRTSEIRYRRLFEAAHDGVLILDPATQKIIDANPFMTKLLGYSRDELVGMELFQIGFLGEAQASQDMFQTLKEKWQIRYEHLPLRSEEGVVREVEVVANLYDEEGRTVVQCNVRDISERKRAEANAQVLMAEVNHRARNMLAVVQAVAQQSAKLGDPQTFAARLSDRINGLAANQDLLVKNLWHGVDITELVLAQLAHFKDMIGLRIHIQGPELILTAAASQTVGMALHELSTNAAKYGSLSNSAGEVHIEWQSSAGPDPVFSMSWVESDGPPVKPRTRTGFGQTVIKRLVEVSLGGTVEIDYAAEGLSWRLQTPGSNVLVLSGGQ